MRPYKPSDCKPRDPKWEEGVRIMFSGLKNSKEIVDTKILGLKIKILPNVFSPAIFFESQWFAQKIAVLANGKNLLEIGPGTGIISLFAVKNGARATVIDINENAVKNTKMNFIANNLSVDAHIGSVYDPLSSEDKYDLIFWNHPFNKTSHKDTDVFLKSVFDYEYEHLRKYIAESAKHLTSQGKLLLGTSNIADLLEIEKIANQYEYDFVLLEKIDKDTEVDGSPVDFRIYEFNKRGQRYQL